jgi:acylphosphatase
MAIRLVVHGMVQGVGYRDAMRHMAEHLGVSGWVRNRRDGTVEAVIAGERDALDALLEWARRGPPAARVDRVETDTTEGSFTAFEVRPTA